jgi:Lysylphosphatidylglycerol synthase TM region
MPYRRRITILRQPAGAFVPKRLSLIRGFGVQLSTAFIGMAMPPTVGHVAVNARYLHRQDVDEGTIAAAVTMSQVVNVVTTVLLLIVFGLLTGSGLSRFKIAPGTDVLIGLAAIAGVIILVAVPQTRAKLTEIVWPHLRSLGPRLLDAISHPLRLAISAGANLAHRRLPGRVHRRAASRRRPSGYPAGRGRLPGRQRGRIGRPDTRRDRRR